MVRCVKVFFGFAENKKWVKLLLLYKKCVMME